MPPAGDGRLRTLGGRDVPFAAVKKVRDGQKYQRWSAPSAQCRLRVVGPDKRTNCSARGRRPSAPTSAQVASRYETLRETAVQLSS